MVWFLGFTLSVKSVAFTATMDELFVGTGSVLLAADTLTAPPLKLPPVVGVTTMVTVAVDPDCNEFIVHTAVLPVAVWLQLPDVAVAELNVTGMPLAPRLSVIVMFVARSGPLFVTV